MEGMLAQQLGVVARRRTSREAAVVAKQTPEGAGEAAWRFVRADEECCMDDGRIYRAKSWLVSRQFNACAVLLPNYQS